MPIPGAAKCSDAVIVLPGIMGSELVESATGRPIWGLADARWYGRAWTSGSSLKALQVTEDEREGRLGRVTASRLLRFPAAAPVLRGVEPYTALVDSIRRTALDPMAVLPFPYDWRLSVTHNAALLAQSADDHLRRWRASPRGSRSAKLVLVAHSMGGLLARCFSAHLGGASEVRTTVTLGTPFRGSAKAVRILNSGRGAPVPLPHRRLRDLAGTMPGLHDLLPSYRSVSDGTGARVLTPGDVAALGGDKDLARNAMELHRSLSSASGGPVRSVVGVWQPTVQTFALRSGVVKEQHWSYPAVPPPDAPGMVDRGGDETVPRDAASIAGEPFYVAQTHGALARTQEVIDHVRGVLTEQPPGAWLGHPVPLSLVVPDLLTAGEPLPVHVAGVSDPAALTCRITDAGSGHTVAHPFLTPHGEGLRSSIIPPGPGMYRVAVKGQAFSPVTQLVMVLPRSGSSSS
ncbi:lipase/acyltransferase domain-containing protein [Symbioplanes lichenis]|uniref:lipase/acyltransferase domain-containing protein n=1 Tax=Symbioplanes lichenis TaxID=1629072 RepID=UPI002738382F|nr:hypothetical protein [Actinoplanes lichenis]